MTTPENDEIITITDVRRIICVDGARKWAKAQGIDFRAFIRDGLPAAFEYLSFDSAAAVADGIREMVVRGAPAIGVAAAYGVALEALRMQIAAPADFDQALIRGFDRLAASRPTAAAA